jgi:hypothetical protein
MKDGAPVKGQRGLAGTTQTSSKPQSRGLEVAENLFGDLLAGEAEFLGEDLRGR